MLPSRMGKVILIVLFLGYLTLLGGIFYYRNRPDVSSKFPFIQFQTVSSDEKESVSWETSPMSEKFAQSIYLPPSPPPVITTVTPLPPSPPPVVDSITTTTWEPPVEYIETPEEVTISPPYLSAFLP